jgi:hypothetical protein
MRLLAEQLLHDFLHFRHARHAADQHDLVDLRGRDAGILDRLLAGLNRFLNEIIDQRLELGAGEFHRQMFLTRSICRDEWQIDLRLRSRRQLDLRLLRSFLETLQCELVAAQINALLFLELVREIVHEPHIEVFAAQERIAVRGLHFKTPSPSLGSKYQMYRRQIVDSNGSRFHLVSPWPSAAAIGSLMMHAFKAGNFPASLVA